MKKTLLLILVIALVCIGHVTAEDNRWSIGAQINAFSGIQAVGGYDTLTVGIGYTFMNSRVGISASGFYPFQITENFRLGPGVAFHCEIRSLTRSGEHTSSNWLATLICGFEYTITPSFGLVAQLGYPSFERYGREPILFSYEARTILYSSSLSVRYYF